MSRSYKKVPVCCYKSKILKKLFNRRIRRNKKYDVFSYGHYRKMNDSWDICDWIFRKDWEKFWKDSIRSYEAWGFRFGLKEPDKKEEYRNWYTRYKGK